MSLIHYNFESQYLNNNTDVNIILPDKPRDKTPEQFYGSGKKYKVLWLLHGTFGTTPTGFARATSSCTPASGT